MEQGEEQQEQRELEGEQEQREGEQEWRGQVEPLEMSEHHRGRLSQLSVHRLPRQKNHFVSS